MARKKRRKRKSTQSSTYQEWEVSTKNLLSELQDQRDELAARVNALDEEIESIGSMVSRSGLGGVKKRSAIGKAGGKGKKRGPRGLVSGAVLSALSGKSPSSVDDVISKTGLTQRQVYSTLMNLKTAGKVKSPARGQYLTTAKGRATTKSKTTNGRRKKRGPGRPPKSNSAAPGAASASILTALGRSGPLSKQDLAGKTGLDGRQVHMALQSLIRNEKVKASASGTYRAR